MAPTGLQLGDSVLYTLPEGPSAGQARPAVCVRAWNATCGNFLVFVDGGNDIPSGATLRGQAGPVVWLGSLCEGPATEAGTWHRPATAQE